MDRSQYIFVIDPMCSWCWGFHPVIERLCQEYEGIYSFSLVVGGLRTKGTMQWNEPAISKLKATWKQVSETTGQQFTDNLFKLDNFDYDTYPACKAIVTVRELWGDEAAFEYLGRIQKAFYVEGVDITDMRALARFIDRDRQQDFVEFYQGDRAEVLMRHDFSKARSMGANAFPSVVRIDSDGHMVCKQGFQRFDDVIIDT